VVPAPVNEPVDLPQAVFTQEPILPNAQRSSERAPRKRAAKKSVAAQAQASAPVTSVLPAQDRHSEEDASHDAVNVGPVANRRRTQI
jgi:hypothetical protein